MAKRSDFRRRPHDAYNTIDARAVRTLIPYLYGIRKFAEPCVGRGDLMFGLEKMGLECVLQADIMMGLDALDDHRLEPCAGYHHQPAVDPVNYYIP